MSTDPTAELPEQPDADHPINGDTSDDVSVNDTAPPRTPAGWYPTPDGRQRYWDGSAWTDLPWSEADPLPISISIQRVPRVKWTPKRRKIILIAGATLLVVAGLLVGGLALKGANDRQVASAKIAKIHTAEQLAAAEAKASAEAAVEAKRVKDDAERAGRVEAVTGIEASVKTMAEKDVAESLLDGPILSVKCSPIGSGSTNDLTQLTSVFECFAANKDNGDGSQSGYTFHANMNWSDGSYTYGLGKANG